MDSAWGNNGLTSVNCGGGGVWGSNPGPSLSRGSIWNTGGSAKRSSGDSWSSLKGESKIDGSSGWGGLISDGSGYRARNGSPGSNVGVSAGPDSDADPWGQSSGHGSSSSWGSASTSDNKDASGWGSLDPSPVPNAGTEGWGFRPGGQNEGRPNDWKKDGANASLGISEKDAGPGFLLPEDPKRTGQFPSNMSLWSGCRPSSGPSHGQDAGSGETNPTDAAQKAQTAEPGSGGSNRGVSPAGSQDSASEEQPLTRDEIIRRAINSSEGWGKTPIRQDTAWNIDEEPKKPFPLLKPDDTPADRSRPAPRDRSGSLSWSQPVEPSADKSRTGSAVWSSVVAENSGLGMILKEMRGDLVGELKAAPPPTDTLPETGWPARPAAKDADWGSNLTLTDGPSWEDGRKDPTWDSAESGRSGLTRSASAGAWSGDEGDGRGWSKGDCKGSNAETETQNWKPGYKSSMSVPPPAESLFNVPPPQFGGDGFGGLVGPWGNAVKQPKVMEGWGDVPQWSMGGPDQRSRAPSATDWNASDAGRRGLSMSNMGDIGKPPQMRAHLLQRLIDMGFKKEDAQTALISNNLNMDSAISKLLANQMRGVGLESEPDTMTSRRPFQGAANHVNLSMLAGRADLPPDVAACLVNLLQNGPNGSTGSVPLGPHLGGATGATTQMRSPPGGSGPSFTPNHLDMLSSLLPGLLPALQQKLVQPGARPDNNNPQAAQVSALQQALLQNVQGAIQANLVPPHLITAQSLTPTVLIKLQQMMDMYQALQGLSARYQLMRQDNLALVQSRQHPQSLGEIEAIMASFKQQIYQTQQQVLQELTVLQPPPLPSAAGVDQLLKNFASLQGKEDAFPGPSLMNQWKGDDAMGHPNAPNPNIPHSVSAVDSAPFSLNSQWMPSISSCWTRAGSDPTGAPFALSEGTTGESNGAGSVGSEDGSAGPQLEIAEFIPGIPWQGLSSGKSAEDDPHLTPGSVAQGQFSSASPLPGGASADPSGISKSLISNANLSAKVSPWSPVDSSLATSDPWARNHAIPSAMASYQNKVASYQQQQTQAPNRGISWSGGDRNAYKSLPPSSPCLPSNWLRLKNIAPQVDNRMLQALCEQSGPLECFVPNLTREYVIVKYIKLDDACKAQRSLHACPIAGQSLVAEYLNKYEVFQIIQQGPTSGVPTQAGSKPFGGPAGSPYQFGKAPTPDRWNLPFGGGLGAGANPWSVSAEEHSLYLPNSKQHL